MSKSSVKNQYFATICVNIISVAFGSICGWPSASFPVLESEDSPLASGPMTRDASSWVAAMLCIGGFTGNIIFGLLCDRIGRKWCLLFIALPELIGWIFIMFAKNTIYLIIGRFLGGFAGGGLFVVVPLYIVEISEDKVRGFLGSFLVLSCNIGMLCAFLLGNYIDYTIIPYILAIFPALFLVGFIFLPETPIYLYKANKDQEGEKSLRYFRNVKRTSKGIPETFRAEIEELRNHCAEKAHNDVEDSFSMKDLSNPVIRKAFLIGIVLMCLNQLCGCFAMMNYAAIIFHEAGSSLSPNLSTIIVGVIQLLGSYFSTMLVERAGRKLLMCISAFGTGVGLVCLGTFLYLSVMGFDVAPFGWIPVTSFSFTLFIASWGVLTLPFVIVAEIMLPRLRGFGSSFCMSILWCLSFIALKFLPDITRLLGMHGSMFLFSAFSFIGGIFVLCYVPETKGKSVDAIIKMLE